MTILFLLQPVKYLLWNQRNCSLCQEHIIVKARWKFQNSYLQCLNNLKYIVTIVCVVYGKYSTIPHHTHKHVYVCQHCQYVTELVGNVLGFLKSCFRGSLNRSKLLYPIPYDELNTEASLTSQQINILSSSYAH